MLDLLLPVHKTVTSGYRTEMSRPPRRGGFPGAAASRAGRPGRAAAISRNGRIRITWFQPEITGPASARPRARLADKHPPG